MPAPTGDAFIDLVANRELHQVTLKAGADPGAMNRALQERNLTSKVVWVLPQPDGSYSFNGTAEAAKVIRMLPEVASMTFVSNPGEETAKQLGLV